VAYQVTLRLRHNFLLAGENPMLTRMLLPFFHDPFSSFNQAPGEKVEDQGCL